MLVLQYEALPWKHMLIEEGSFKSAKQNGKAYSYLCPQTASSRVFSIVSVPI
jgi:hypothetical protein